MIPADLLSAFSMNGLIKINSSRFVTPKSNRKNYIYSINMINKFITKVANKQILHYDQTDLHLYNAIEKYPIYGNIIIVGSEEPCYEALAIYHNAKPITVEYEKILSEDSRLSTITIDEFTNSNTLFDFAISISSVEHSGLGRYGDPLDPDGDLKAMELLLKKLKPNGLCFLAIPYGNDYIEYNLHRIYGKYRFPLLIKNWTIIDVFGAQKDVYPNNNNASCQPVFILRKLQ